MVKSEIATDSEESNGTNDDLGNLSEQPEIDRKRTIIPQLARQRYVQQAQYCVQRAMKKLETAGRSSGQQREAAELLKKLYCEVKKEDGSYETKPAPELLEILFSIDQYVGGRLNSQSLAQTLDSLKTDEAVIVEIIYVIRNVDEMCTRAQAQALLSLLIDAETLSLWKFAMQRSGVNEGGKAGYALRSGLRVLSSSHTL